MFRSDLCHYSNAYIVVKGDITVTNSNNNVHDKKLAFKSNAPFTSSILKINSTLINNAEHLDIVMPMYSLIEYSKNYSKTTGSLWNQYRDESYGGAEASTNYSVKDSKYFDYKTKITRRLQGSDTEKELEIVVPLKHLSKFWRTLDIPLMNCEINLILTWSENCVITSKTARDVDPDTDPAVAAVNNLTNATFQIKDTNLYIPVVTLSAKNDNKISEQLETGFKTTIKWNKYRSEMTTQTKTNNLNSLIDPIFNKANRLFVLSFENEDDRFSISKD